MNESQREKRWNKCKFEEFEQRIDLKGEIMDKKTYNAKITNVSLSMADHGCLTFGLSLDGGSIGCVYGGYCLGYGYLGGERV